MNLLAADFTESLRHGEPRIEALRTVGDPDPGAAAAAFSLALKEPALSPHAEIWVPMLLRSARPGRGAEHLLAEFVDPDLEPPVLLEEISAAQERIRAAFESVVERNAISALSD